MNENTKNCPICPKGCDLSEPGCGRGAEYAKTGKMPEKDHDHDCGHEHGHGHGHGYHHGGHRQTDAEREHGHPDHEKHEKKEEQ